MKKPGPFANRSISSVTNKSKDKDEVSKVIKQIGFNELIKAPAFLLAYLYLVSICYHFGYWNDFEIDIFNFYSAQDLIKGATYGMKNTFNFILMFAIPYLIMYFLFTSKAKAFLLNWVRKHRFSYIVINAALLITLYYITNYTSMNKVLYRKMTVNVIPGINNQPVIKGYFYLTLVFIFVYASVTGVRRHFSKVDDFKERVFNIFLYSFTIALPPLSYISGLDTNLFIRRGIEFDYIVNSSITKNKAIYKYLGKASDHYFLHTIDGRKTIVIKTDSIQPLIINHFHADDSTSSKLFLAINKEIIKARKAIPASLKPKKVKSPPIVADTIIKKLDMAKGNDTAKTHNAKKP